MPKKPRADEGKLREDANETAYRVLQEATGERPKSAPPSERTEDQKNPEAVKRGAKGGAKGGKRRAGTLTPEERKSAASHAARIRWQRDADQSSPSE